MKHMTWTNDPKPDPNKSYKSSWLISYASTSILHTRYLAISWVTVSWNPSSLQGLTIVLSFERGDILILLIEHSL